ncbi:MAG: hypothetical protein V1709_01570 [Planctomycetota bacterium]
MRKYYIIAILFLVAFVTVFNYVGCGGGGGGGSSSGSSTPPTTTVPSLTTKPATNVLLTSATLNGTVNPNGVSTTIYFQYGTSLGYGSTTLYQSIGSGASSINVFANVTGLTPNTNYNFRVVVSRSGSTFYGSNLTFKTLVGTPPTCTTNAADNITTNSARLNGTVDPNGLNVTSCYFQWGTTTDYFGGSPTATPSTFGITSSVSANISSLSISTTYNFRVVATNIGGTTNGNNLTFTTGTVATVVCSGPDQITSGIQSSSFTAISRDISNNIVSDTYTWTNANGTGTANLIGDTLTGVTAGTVRITATSVANPAISGGKTVTVIPGAVVTVTVSGADSITSAGTSETYTAVSEDAAGNNVSETYTWSHTDDAGSITRTTNTITGFLTGAVTITATGTGAVAGGRVVTVTPGAINDYLVIPASYSVVTGTNQTATITARDVNGNTVTTDSSTVITATFVVITGTTVTTGTFYTNDEYITTTDTYTLNSGIATICYRAVHDGTPPNWFTITATDDNDKEGTSETVGIYSNPTKLVFTVQPTDTPAGSAFNPTVEVSVEDDYDNIVPSAVNTITITGPAGVTLGVITTTDAISGTATFTGMTVSGIASAGYTLTATSAGLTLAISNPFSITYGAANNLAFVAQPQSDTAGDTWAPVTVSVTDSYGNDVPDVSVTISNNNGTAINGSLTQLSDASGIATFSPLSMTLAADNYVLSATSGALATTSSAFNITPAAANNLVFVQQPTTTISGATFSTITVRVRDIYNNFVTTANDTVVLAVSAGATLGGTTSVDAAGDGTATFSAVTLTSGISGTGYTLTATSGVLTEAVSNPFAIIGYGAATTLAWVTNPPATTIAGNTMTAFTVRVTDALGNNVQGTTVSITTTVTTPLVYQAGTAVANATADSDASGIASFGTISMTLVGTYALSASVGTLYAPPSTLFDITPAAANNLAFVQQPTTTTAGNIMTPAFTVRVTDQYGNNVQSTTVSITTTVSSLAVYQGGTQVTNYATADSDASGIAIFSTISMTQVGTGYIFRASSGSLTPVDSTAFNIATVAVDDYCWVANSGSNTVTRIKKSDSTTTTIAITGATNPNPRAVAVDETYVWVANVDSVNVTRISKSDLSTITIAAGRTNGVSVDETYCWVANYSETWGLTRIRKSDSTTTTIAGVFSVVAVDGTYCWAAANDANTVTRIRKSDFTTTTITVGTTPRGIAVDGTYCWVANASTNNVTRILKSDLSTTSVAIATTTGPYALTVDDTYCWVTHWVNANVTRILKTDLSTTTIAVQTSPYGVSVDGTYCWVANFGSGTVTRILKSNLNTTTIQVGSQPFSAGDMTGYAYDNYSRVP